MQIFSWGAVLAGIGLCLYTAFVIRGEKDAYLAHANPYSLGRLSFKVPTWWTARTQSETELDFLRSDTRYDWKAQLRWHPSPTPESLEEILARLLTLEGIVLDPEEGILHSPSSWQEHSSCTEEEKRARRHFDFLRVESTGTQNLTERLYLDIALLRHKESGEWYELRSQSSVLNGSVEGPYFEEVLNGLRPV